MSFKVAKISSWMPIIGIVNGLAAVAASAGVDTTSEESPDVYKIVAQTAITVLPDPLRPFFEEHHDALEVAAIKEILPPSTNAESKAMASRHYVMLDAVGSDDVRRFPKNRDEALRRFRQRGAKDGGELPWVILDRQSTLVSAFRSGSTENIVREAGALLHYATDASLPFNTMADRDDGVRWPIGEADLAGAHHHTVRHRYQIGLIQHLRDRLAYEVRVFPGRFRHSDDPSDAVFTALFDAHESVDALSKIDAAILADLDVHDHFTFQRVADAYYDQLALRAGWMMESRLEAGALLSAELIGKAWTNAGSPGLNVRSGTPPVSKADESSNGALTSPYVGSLNSTVFHKASCRHVRRIKSTNLVPYGSAEAARQAGRTPCKSCLPDNP